MSLSPFKIVCEVSVLFAVLYTKENFISNMNRYLRRKKSCNRSVGIALLLETHLGDLHYGLGSQLTDCNLIEAVLQA